jgi:hypothetical protein
LAQVTFEATMEAARKYDEYKKAKAAKRRAKNHRYPQKTRNF